MAVVALKQNTGILRYAQDDGIGERMAAWTRDDGVGGDDGVAEGLLCGGEIPG
jgi:hypothetical protein